MYILLGISFICIQGQSGGDRERQTGKTWGTQEGKLCWDLSPGRQAGQRGDGAESSSVVQTSMGTTTFHAFSGTFYLHFCTSLYSCTAQVCSGLTQGAVTAGSSDDFDAVPTDGFKTTLSLKKKKKTSESLP